MIEELDKLIKDRELYNKLLEELQYDKTVVLPTKTYKGNCSKEYCEKIVDLYIDREFDRIQEMDFPPTVEHPLTLSQCQTEFINLLNNDKKWKSPSYLVRYFHKSIMYASVGNIGKNRHDEHNNSQTAYPMGKAAPEKVCIAERFYI